MNGDLPSSGTLGPKIGRFCYIHEPKLMIYTVHDVNNTDEPNIKTTIA